MAQVGAELQLFYGTTGSTPATEILNITNIEVPEVVTADVKNTHYSTTGKVHDYIPGFKEGGEIVVTMDFSKAMYATLKGLQDTRKAWKIGVGGAEAGDSQGEGYINKIGGTFPVDEKLMIKFSIKACTDLVWTPAA